MKNFKDTLFSYVQFAFDNDRQLLREFVTTGMIADVDHYDDVVDCDLELNEFFMSGSLCLLEVEYFDSSGEWRTKNVRIKTSSYLDWVYKINGGTLDE